MASGILKAELGGLTAGSLYDQLVVNGSVALDGTLDVSLIGGFVPLSGNAFLALTFASRLGAFATIIGLNQGSAILTANYNATNLTLLVL